MWSRILLALACAASLVGFALASPGTSTADPFVGPAARVVGASDDTGTPFNLVDLPALFRHRADGRDLRLGHELVRRPGWSRYAISYRSDGLRVTGTLVLQRSTTPAPVVVALHGFQPPGRYLRGSGLVREENRLADAGFVVLHPDYRNYGGSTTTSGAAVAAPLGYPSDVVNGIVALRAAALPGVDTGRLGLLGRSMGGGVALQVAEARPDLVDALLLYSPVSSSAALDFDRFTRHAPALAARVAAAYGTPGTAPGRWHDASAASYLDRIDVPVQIHHGLADRVCPEAWSVGTTAALRAAGKHVRLFTYAGQPHRFTEKAWPLFMARAVAYFAARLGVGSFTG